MKRIFTPLTKELIKSLNVGDEILLTGIIYTARDQAHKRLIKEIGKRRNLIKDKIIYYCGPTQTPKGKIIGSAGPTTSSRMDEFTPKLLAAGLIAMIGKGARSEKVRQSIKRHKAVYFLAPAGCGALLSQKIKSKRIVAYKDLGPEAIYELKVKDFPLIVGIDSKGRSIYDTK
ncbi:MAG: FumA C-terminus/TtdB family hydratase beta subunit [Candidatus Omnitrophica bacterium]|nr:FumA C-terminus/TtdB family hydratase beta subunit [Candidatus Omnitrophota bacterium]HOX54012.1 FumA C-terminus/TtdB family hydratase beta subunit [Candidatus Omnitrophota bacterium]